MVSVSALFCRIFLWLLLIPLTAGLNCCQCHGNQNPYDETQADPAATNPSDSKDETEPKVSPIPAQLVPIVRFQGDVGLLDQIGVRGDELTGNQDWRDDDLLMSVLPELKLDEVQKGMIGRRFTFTYEFFIVMPQNGSTETSYALLLAAPISRSDMELILGNQIQELQQDAEGFASRDDLRLLVTDAGVALLHTEGNYVIADEKQLLHDAITRLERDPPKRAFEAIFEPRKIRTSIRQPYLAAVQAALHADIQQRDHEEPLIFRSREVYGKVVVQLLDLVFNQLDSLSFSLNFHPESKQLHWMLQLDAVPRSGLDHWILRQHEVQNRAVESLHPDQTSFLSLAIALPEVIQQCLPDLGKAFADSLTRDGWLSTDSARQVQQAIASIAASDSLLLLLQALPDTDATLTLLATLPFSASVDLTAASIELVSATKNSGWLIADSDIDGWPVHLYPDFFDLVFPNVGHDFQFVSTDRQVTLQLTSEDSRSRLQEVVRHDYDITDAAQPFRRSGLSAQFRLFEILRLLGFGDDVIRSMFGDRGLRETNLSDRITTRMETSSHRLQVHTAFEDDATVAGAIGFSSLLGLAIESADSLLD